MPTSSCASPSAARAVIDASAGVVRPSLAELGLATKRPPLVRVVRVDPRAPIRRPAQVWFAATDDATVYEAMLPTDPPRDEDGDPVVMPAVRRDVLDAICREIVNTGFVWRAGLSLSWVDDVLVVESDYGHARALMPGPDGLYEVGRLSYSEGPAQWVEVDPPLPGGPIDADTAVALLSRVRTRDPVLNLLFG